MTPAEAERFANELLREHGLDVLGWRFEWDRAVKRLGATKFRRDGLGGRVTLSRPLAVRNPSSIDDTLRHEVAHALAGPKAGHGWQWVAACRVTGANPQRTAHVEVKVEAPWVGVCPNGHETQRFQRPSAKALRVSCGQCSPVYDERYRYTWRTGLEHVAAQHADVAPMFDLPLTEAARHYEQGEQ